MDKQLTDALLSLSPLIFFFVFLYFFFRWHFKKNRPQVDEHLQILRERNEIARETNELLKQLLAKKSII